MFSTAGRSITEESFFPSKNDSWLNRIFPRNGMVLTAATRTQTLRTQARAMLWDEKEGHVPTPGRCFGKKRVFHFPGQCLTAEPCSVLLAFLLEMLHFRETIASCLGWACRQVPGLKPCGAANPALPLCLETPVASADLVIAGSSHYSFLLLLESAILRFKCEINCW